MNDNNELHLDVEPMTFYEIALEDSLYAQEVLTEHKDMFMLAIGDEETYNELMGMIASDIADLAEQVDEA